jgi:hypothetical protein
VTRSLLLLALIAPLALGCKSQSGLTASATGCRAVEVDIVDSEFKRAGSTTAWCAKCRGKRYQCATGASRDKVHCFEARPGTTCY